MSEELAKREDYKGNAAAQRVFDLSFQYRKKAPPKDEVTYWAGKWGNVDDYESMLRGDIRWEKGSDGRTYKFYNAAALERRGGGIGKGVNKGGEIIVTPAGIPVSSKRYESTTEGGLTYYTPMGSRKKGLGERALGSSVGGGIDRAVGAVAGVANFIPGAAGSADFIAAQGGERGQKQYAKVTKGMLEPVRKPLSKTTNWGFTKDKDRFAQTFEAGRSITRSVVSTAGDAIMFGGLPVLSSANRLGEASKASAYGQDVKWGRVGRDIAIDWAAAGTLNKITPSAGVKPSGTSFATPRSFGSAATNFAVRTGVKTAAGIGKGQEADVALIGAVAGETPGLTPVGAAVVGAGVPLYSSPELRAGLRSEEGEVRLLSYTTLAANGVLGYYGAGGFSKPAAKGK